MSELRTIEIDFEIHKAIEAERSSFSEPPYVALRRLLKMAPPTPSPNLNAPQMASAGKSWTGDGVTLAHGTRIRMDYNGRRYDGVIDNGEWLVEGQRFTSPSGAASGVAITKKGDRTKLDGWGYWEVCQPTDAGWTALSHLRRRKIALI